MGVSIPPPQALRYAKPINTWEHQVQNDGIVFECLGHFEAIASVKC